MGNVENLNDSNDIEYKIPVMKVIGLGGGGCNAINRMIAMGFNNGIEYIAANTDSQVLATNLATKKILMGPNLTHGCGAGGHPEIGEKAALESEAELREALSNTDIVFLTAGMGGGTGSGSIPVAARIAQEAGAITISVVNTPFQFEGGHRIENARTYLSKLATYSDTLIAIPNDQLLKVCPKTMELTEAFQYADDVLRQGITGISQLLSGVGVMNVDFSHIRAMMLNGGGSLLSIGYGEGPDRVSAALNQALNHPLLEHLPIENATGIIANFTGSDQLTFGEMIEGMNYLQYLTNNQAEIIPGQIVDNSMGDKIEVILIITGMASMPIETLSQNHEKKDNARSEAKIVEPVKTISDTVVKSDVVAEEAKAENSKLETVMAVNSSKKEEKIAVQQSGKKSKLNISPAADAAFETFMSPLGLSGFKPATAKQEEKPNEVDTSADLDIPTFIRRRM